MVTSDSSRLSSDRASRETDRTGLLRPASASLAAVSRNVLSAGSCLSRIAAHARSGPGLAPVDSERWTSATAAALSLSPRRTDASPTPYRAPLNASERAGRAGPDGRDQTATGRPSRPCHHAIVLTEAYVGRRDGRATGAKQASETSSGRDGANIEQATRTRTRNSEAPRTPAARRRRRRPLRLRYGRHCGSLSNEQCCETSNAAVKEVSTAK